MAPWHGKSPLFGITIETHGEQYILYCFVRYFRYFESCSTQQINHIRSTIQTTDRISRIVIAMMETSTVFFERTGQSNCRAATIIYPTGERTKILKFLRSIFHNQDTCHAPLRLCIESIYINAIDRGFRIHLISNGIPTQGAFRFIQLSGSPQYVFHQEVGHIQTAHAVSVMMDIPPTTAIGYSLISDMVVHGQELLFQFILCHSIRSIVIGIGYPAHQIEILTHLHP